MTKRMKAAAVAVTLLMTTTVIGASAFTTATLERDATIDVTTDSKGLVQFGAGSSGAVYQNGDGELTITLNNDSGSGINGVNPSANYTFGDPAAVNETYAFNMTVDDQMTGSGEMNLSYNLDTSSKDGTGDNVKFDVYRYNDTSNSAELLGTATESSATGLFSVTKGEIYYVVISVDTGVAATESLAAGDELSGTLTVSIK